MASGFLLKSCTNPYSYCCMPVKPDCISLVPIVWKLPLAMKTLFLCNNTLMLPNLQGGPSEQLLLKFRHSMCVTMLNAILDTISTPNDLGNATFGVSVQTTLLYTTEQLEASLTADLGDFMSLCEDTMFAAWQSTQLIPPYMCTDNLSNLQFKAQVPCTLLLVCALIQFSLCDSVEAWERLYPIFTSLPSPHWVRVFCIKHLTALISMSPLCRWVTSDSHLEFPGNYWSSGASISGVCPIKAQWARPWYDALSQHTTCFCSRSSNQQND